MFTKGFIVEVPPLRWKEKDLEGDVCGFFSSFEVFLLVLWRGVTLVWFPFSLLLLSGWVLFYFLFFYIQIVVWFWVDVFARGRFLPGFSLGWVQSRHYHITS